MRIFTRNSCFRVALLLFAMAGGLGLQAQNTLSPTPASSSVQVQNPSLAPPSVSAEKSAVYPHLYDWLPKSGVMFHPNVGQVQHENQTPASEVKFVSEAKGMKLFFTEKGLSYVFVKEVANPNKPATNFNQKCDFCLPKEHGGTVYTSNSAEPLPVSTGYKFEAYRMDMELVGANPNPVLTAGKATDFYHNYYLGGRVPNMTEVHSYRMLTYQNVYPNIDLVFYGNGDFIKYDFVVKPGGDPSQIRIKYNGATSVTTNADGSLQVETPFGKITEKAPFSFQSIRPETKKEDGPALVQSTYAVSGNEVAFNLPNFDAKRLLVIDPNLQWSTYYGGTGGDILWGVVGNNAGDSYSAGISFSADFPRTTGQAALSGQTDGVVIKLDNAGARVWALYYGGTTIDGFGDVTLDAGSNVMLSGFTNSTNITLAGLSAQTLNRGGIDWMVAKFTPAGVLSYSSYLGGSNNDCILVPDGGGNFNLELKNTGLTMDAANRLVVVGNTLSTDFAGTPSSPFQPAHASPSGILCDVAIYRFTFDLLPDFATYYGGNGLDFAHSVACDGAGNIFVTGTTYSNDLTVFNGNDVSINGGVVGESDMFIVKISPSFNLRFATYYGGDKSECPLFTNNSTFIYSDIALDIAGNPTIVGGTFSTNAMVTGNAFQQVLTPVDQIDAFIAKFASVGGTGSLVWGTYAGGTGAVVDFARSISFTPTNKPTVGFWSANGDFPASNGSYQTTHGNPGVAFNGAMLVISPDGTTLDYGTFLGGAGSDGINAVYVDRDSRTYVAGQTSSTNAFLSALTFQNANAGSSDGMIVRFNEAGQVDAPCNGFSNGQPIRILALQYGMDLTEEYPSTLAAMDRYVSNYTLTATPTTDGPTLAGLLATADVCLIPEIEDPAVNFATFSGFATPLQNFVNAGGTVIFTGSNNISGGNFQTAINNTGMFNITGQVSVNIPNLVTTTVNITPLTNGIPAQFNMSPINTSYQLGGGVAVITDGPRASVAYRGSGTGKAVLIGTDYSSYDDNAARILGNAVSWVGNNISSQRMTVSYTKQDQSCNLARNGAIDVTVTNVVGPVSYLWSPNAFNATTQDINDLNPGTYTVTITAGRGGLCTEVLSVAVTGCVTCPLNGYSVNLTATPQDQCAPAAPVTITSTEIKPCGDYDIKNVTFGLIAPPVNAVSLNANISNEEIYGPLPISFPLNFFCKDYSSFYISDNGFITLNERENFFAYFPDVIPGTLIPNNIIGMAWAPWQRGAGNIRYWTQGTAPNRKLVVDYDNFEQDGCTGGNLKGQIIIYEGDSIEFQVQTASISGAGPECRLTQGLENYDGTQGVAVAGRNYSPNVTITNEGKRFVPKTKATEISYEWRLNPSPTILGTNKDLTHTPPNNGVNTYELKIINSARNCSTTKTINVNVNPTTVGGTVGAAQTVCQGQATTDLTLTGNVGAVIRWEKADNAGFTLNPTTVSNTTSTLTPGTLTQTTCYRAVVQSPGCLVQNATGVCITVNPGAIPGTVVAAQTICQGNAPAQFTLTGHSGTIVRWESADDPAFTLNLQPIVNAVATYTSGPLATNKCFRAVLQAGACPLVFSTGACVTVDPASVGGTVSSSQTICQGGTINVLTLSGHIGVPTMWHESPDIAFTVITTIANASTTYQPVGLTQSKCYRAVVQSGSCPSVPSIPSCITVNPTTVGGNVTGAITVCGAPNGGTLTLAGHTGTVVRWESAPDVIFATPTTLNITQNTFNFVDLTQTTCFRAVVKSGSCPAANSGSTCVTVNAGTTPGTLSGQATVCSGNNTGNMTLTGNTGNVVRWETAGDLGFTPPITTINSTTTTLPYNNLTTITCFRAQVQNTGCPIQASNVQCITVDQPSVPGTVSGAATVCSGTNSGTITLSGQTGNVVRWESSTDNFATTTTLGVTTTTLGYTNVTQTTCYRAFVKNGTCNGVTQSTPVCITVTAGSVPGTVSADITVCSGNNTGNLTLAGQSGNILRWETSTDNFGTNTTNVVNTTTTLSYNNLTQTTCVRAVVQSGTCTSATSNVVCVTVSPVTVGGTVSAAQTICSGATPAGINLAGSTGTILKWESSTNCAGGILGAPITSIANITTSLTLPALTQTTCYRAVVQSGACASANSSTITITVDPTTVGGTLTSDATICAGSNPPNLTLNGNTGSVIRWESSTNSFTTITTINSTTTTLAITGLTQATCYRAVVQSGACVSANSSTVCIAVDPVSVGGTVSAPQTICAGATPAQLNLAGNTGTVVRWESATSCVGGILGAPITSVANVTTSLTPSALTQTTCFRAVVQSGSCASATSTTVTIIVDPASVGGTVGNGTTICRGTVPSPLLLTGQTGNVLGWESSTDCPAFLTFSTLAGNTPILNVGAITTTTCYRAVVRSGSCTIVKSNPGTITVAQPSAGGTLTAAQTICSGSAPAALSVTGTTGNVIRWESSTDCFATSNFITPIATTTTTYTSSALTKSTCFRAVVRNLPCNEANSTVVQVTVDPPSAGGTVFTSRTICKGANSGALILAGSVGNIVNWESSTDCALFTNPVNLGNQGLNTYTSGVLTQTTCFRAVVKSGSCAVAYSVPAKVQISTLAATYSLTHIAGCLVNGTIKAVATGGSGGYMYSIAPPVRPSNGTGVFTGLTAGQYTVSVRDGAGCQLDSLVEIKNDTSGIKITRITVGGNYGLVVWDPKPGPGVRYNYRYRLFGSNNPWTQVNNYVGTYAFMQGLDMYTPYEFQIQYTCQSPEFASNFKDTLFTTLETANCYTTIVPPPGGKYVVSVTARRVVIRFRNVTGAMGYVYSYGPAAQNPNTWPQFTICDPQDSVVIVNLAPNTNYAYRMRTLCDNCETISRQKMSNWGTNLYFKTLVRRDGDFEPSFDEVAESMNISVYPNPNRGNFFVSFEANQSENVSVKLYDLTGRIVYEGNQVSEQGHNEWQVDLEKPTSGMYLLEIRKGDFVRTSKVMID